jgi:hypothetical protein
MFISMIIILLFGYVWGKGSPALVNLGDVKHFEEAIDRLPESVEDKLEELSDSSPKVGLQCELCSTIFWEK